MTNEIVKFVEVPFMGTMIQTTDDEKHYVAVKPLVEEIGLRWEKVFLKIKKNKALSSTIATTAMVANDGKMREMVCLPLNMLNGLLFLMNPEDYNHNPVLKAKLESYQQECYNVLYQYFTKGYVFSPEKQEQLDKVIVQVQRLQNMNNALSAELAVVKSRLCEAVDEIQEKDETIKFQKQLMPNLAEFGKKNAKGDKKLTFQSASVKANTGKAINQMPEHPQQDLITIAKYLL